ncbi:MAG: squalene/phytoene synthase family protein [Halothiobacillaceae bacterium]
MDILSYCRDQAAPPGSPSYYACRFLPEQQKPAALAVLALRAELLDASTRIPEPSVAQARLDWWLAELSAAAAGTAQHPIAQALMQHVLHLPGRLELLEEMVAGAQDRLRHGYLEQERDFGLHAFRHEVAPWLILTDPEGGAGRAERDFAHAIGQALAWVRVLHQLGRDAARGQVLIPRETLARHGLDVPDLLQPRTSEAVRAMLEKLGAQVRGQLRHARTMLPSEAQPQQVMALVSLAQADALLEAMAQDDWRLLDARPELTPLHLLWLSWRTARKARSRKA